MELPEDLSGTFWELYDSELSFDSDPDGFGENVMVDNCDFASDDVPLGQGASITCEEKERIVNYPLQILT